MKKKIKKKMWVKYNDFKNYNNSINSCISRKNF